MNRMPKLSSANWIKSSYSGGNGGECVEWAPALVNDVEAVPVRDSKAPHGPALLVPTPAWSSFVSAVQQGELGNS